MSLVFDDVTRRFGDVVALNRLSLELRPGVLALVGPNGSGKSTFMKVATGQVRPMGGTVKVLGQPVWGNPSVLHHIGYVPEQDAFYESMTGLHFVTFLAGLSGMDDAVARRAAKAELEGLGLGDAMDRPIKGYSKGMRQRVKLAQALVHKPKLLLLDEPLLGCDPVARRRIADRILALKAEGCTIVFSTHILPEVEQVTRDIAVLVGGRLVARGQAGEVRDALTQIPSRVRVHTKQVRHAAADMAGWDDVQGVTMGHGYVDVSTARLRAFLENLQHGGRRNWDHLGHETLDGDLESVFGYLAGGSA